MFGQLFGNNSSQKICGVFVSDFSNIVAITRKIDVHGGFVSVYSGPHMSTDGYNELGSFVGRPLRGIGLDGFRKTKFISGDMTDSSLRNGSHRNAIGACPNTVRAGRVTVWVYIRKQKVCNTADSSGMGWELLRFSGVEQHGGERSEM